MARPRHEEERRGVVGWVQRWWRALLAEVLSTALLVWLGCATVVPPGGGSVPLTHPALGFGFVVVANVVAFGEVSGAHMNPAVTLGALLYGRLEALAALGYVAAQVLGAVLGFSALMATSAAGEACVTLPAATVSPVAACVWELLVTGVLVLVVCGVWAAPPDNTAPLKLGLVVAGLVYAAGPATGASLNPARSFAPALLLGVWKHHWVYWAGPLCGGALAALLQRWVLTPPPSPAPAHDAQLPLNDKP